MGELVVTFIEGDHIIATGVPVRLSDLSRGSIARIEGDAILPMTTNLANGQRYRMVASDGRTTEVFVTQMSVDGSTGQARAHFRLCAPLTASGK